MKNITGPLKKSMSNRLRILRKKLDLTQKVFAKQLGVVIDIISDIETERQLPTISLIIGLMKTYHLSPTWLLTGEGEMFINVFGARLIFLIFLPGSIPPGYFETPGNGRIVSTSIAVTGWALDDVGLEWVKIYHEPIHNEGNQLIYIGDGFFADGARRDAEQAYPDYPNNSKEKQVESGI
jgi:DNA-binding XRE family transcriptional regulator